MAAGADRIDFIDRDDVIGLIDAEFVKLEPDYVGIKRAFQEEIGPLRDRMLALQDGGHPVWRSQQILSEAIWLNEYTLDWPRLRACMARLRHSLEPDEVDKADQKDLVPSDDGGYWQGSDEFFIALDLTTDALQRDDVPERTLKILKPYLQPGRLLAYLHRLQTTDIAATRVNDRSELGSAESAFAQFLIKPKLRGRLADPELWKVPKPGTSSKADDIAFALIRLSQTFEDFLTQTQHPRTGYWGPWYRIGGELLQLHDLSFTFHVVNYRKGDVSRWNEIVETTLEIGRLGLLYPYGWKPSDSASPYSNHHNVDAVTLLKYGFDRPEVDDGQRRQIATVVYDMLSWCLTKSLTCLPGRPFCGFVEVDEYDTTQKFGFGVGFLRLVGFFDAGQRFWWNPTQEREPWWPDPVAVARGLLAAVDALKVDSSFTDDIREILAPLVRDSPSGPAVG